MNGRLGISGLTAAMIVVVTAVSVSVSAGVVFAAGGAPVKQIVVSHVGWDVNRTKEREGAPQAERNLCTAASNDECQPGVFNSGIDGFERAEMVAGGPAPAGDVYVADKSNNRVEEFTPTGEFVLMFGKHVNKTTGADICTQAEVSAKGVECQKGEAGGEAGALNFPKLVAVDPSAGGDVYVEELENHRVDAYTPAGNFVWMVGKEVNQTKKTNLCTEHEIESEGVTCKAGTPIGPGAASEHGAFVDPGALAAGPGHVLYVGDEHTVQEFDQEGGWTAEIRQPLEQVSAAAGSTVSSLAVDATGDVYLVYEVGFQAHTILEFDPAGKATGEFAFPQNTITNQIALDPAGRLAVTTTNAETRERSGALYQVESSKTLHKITEFDAENGAESRQIFSIAFDGNGDMYAGAYREILVYKPVPVGELTVANPEPCVPGAERETDVTLDCELDGTVDPWGVPKTEVWFEWGRTPVFGERTAPKTPVAAKSPQGTEEPPTVVKAPIAGVLPDETIYDRVAGEDENVISPEFLSSPTGSFTTESVPPRVIGQPTAFFVRANSADLFGEINPENTETQYEFQYAPAQTCQQLEGCTEAGRTGALKSNAYGKLGVMLEASNLKPATEYRYRLYAVNHDSVTQTSQPAVNETGGQQLPEGVFTTAPPPVPLASTGAPRAIGQNTATITGSIDPNGQQVVYSFEAGVYEGANTQYATVYSGPGGTSETPIEETLTLTGLQPNTTYAYRIAVKSGYAENETHTIQGTPTTFTTQTTGVTLPPPPTQTLLPTPPTQFPHQTSEITQHKTTLTRAQELKNALSACGRKPKRQRSSCEKSARHKYAVKPKKKGKA